MEEWKDILYQDQFLWRRYVASIDKIPLRIEARRCEDELCLVKVHVTVAMLLFVKCEQKNELTVI